MTWSTGQNLVMGKKWGIFGELGAAGGGPSLAWQQPDYQAAVVPAALSQAPGSRGGPVRSAPDISADADPFTGMAIGLLKSHQNKPAAFGMMRIAGTSLAALRDVLPLAASSNSLFRGVACNARSCFQQILTTFDDQNRSMLDYSGQVTAKGYDNMTGVGTPAGQRFISALRGLES